MNVCMYLCIMYVCMYMSEISYTAVMQLPITFYIHRSMHAMPCIQSCMQAHSCTHAQMSRLSLNNWVDHKWTCGGDPRTAQTPRVHVNARACARCWGEQSQSGEWRRGNRFVSRSPSFPLLSFLPSFRPSVLPSVLPFPVLDSRRHGPPVSWWDGVERKHRLSVERRFGPLICREFVISSHLHAAPRVTHTDKRKDSIIIYLNLIFI